MIFYRVSLLIDGRMTADRDFASRQAAEAYASWHAGWRIERGIFEPLPNGQGAQFKALTSLEHTP